MRMSFRKKRGISEIQAGRRTLERLSALADAGMDMAFETTLASHLLLPRIRRMQASGEHPAAARAEEKK